MNPVYRYLAIFAVGLLIGWFVNGWRLEADYNGQLASQRAEDLLNYSRQVILYKTSLEKSEVSRSDMTKKLQEKEHENQMLADAVASGTKRLSVRARCPRMSAPETNAGRVEAATTELDASARPAYFALRSGIERTESLLKFCQTELSARSDTQP